MIILTNPGSVVYPSKFKAGDIAIAKEATIFTDGTKEFVGQRIVVKESTCAYFNVNHEIYEKGN